MTGFAPDIKLPWDFNYGEANSPWEVRQKVRLLVHDGVDHIKVLSTGAVLTHGSNPNAQEFTLEELQAAVSEANNFGLRVAVHAHAPQGIKNAIRAGVTSVEHATLIDDEGIALAKEHGTYLDMDIYQRRRGHPGGGESWQHPSGFSGARSRPGGYSAAKFYQGSSRRSEDDVRDGRGSLPL